MLIDTQDNFFGEAGFRAEPEARGYLRLDSTVFNRLFGEFSPTRGDLVYAKTGELLGLMVNNRYAKQLDNLEPGTRIPLGDRFNPDNTNQLIEALETQVESLPSELQ